MATNVDERIVAAKFDSSDFEKGVDKTIKKLDELKKSLNLKEATKGVEELAEKTEASTNSMSKSLDKLTERFTTFVGMIKQKILSGLADEVAGVFLKMEQSIKGFIKSISSDQVSAGMSKYEQMLSSVRVMMSAGESEKSAYAAIEQLRDYSDQTSYSLSQMTDALSKLRSAGVDLDTATKSVEGIANACANAGINATDAARAFYNLSQAYSSGVLKYTDYRSLELLNLTTEKFKDQLLEAAVTAGTLEKVSENTYKTINKNNKKVTAGKKVTAQNLQDMLRYNFVTSEVMNELFGGKFFFDEQTFRTYKRKYKDLDQAIAAAKKDYGETAVNAYLAAREARNFTDVMNTLKDVVSTGWATTFEHLFGKLEQAKKFFTSLAEEGLADVIYKFGEYRNTLLEFWNDTDAEGNGRGAKVLTDSILNISKALGTLIETFQMLLPGFRELSDVDDEGNLTKEAADRFENLGDRIYRVSLNIRDFTMNLKEAANNFQKFMTNDTDEEGNKIVSRIERIRKTMTNLAAVFGIVGKVVVLAMDAISKTFYTLSPIFDGFIVLMEKVTAPLVNLKNNADVFDDVENSINNIQAVLDPIAKALGTIVGFLGEVGAFFVQMAIDGVTMNIEFFSDALGLLLELITGKSSQLEKGEGILEGIRKEFEGIKNACTSGLNAVKEFFGALIGDIKTLLGLNNEAQQDAEGNDGGLFSGLIKFFNTNQFVQDAKKWVDQAIIDVGNFIRSIPERVLAFGASIYDTLWHLFFREETTESPMNSQAQIKKTVLTPLGEWVDQAIKDITNFFINLPDMIIQGVGTVTGWVDEVFNSWFGKKGTTELSKQAKEGKEVTGEDSPIRKRFEDFIANAKTSISEWFADLPNKIRTAFSNIGNFITNLYNAIDEFLFGKKYTLSSKKEADLKKRGITAPKGVAARYKTGFSKWLDSVINELKKFIQNVPLYIKEGIKGTGDIVSSIISALFGTPDNKQVTNKDVEDQLEKPFLNIDLSNVLTTIADFGKEILNQIARIFTGSEDVDANMNWFSEKIAEGIRWIREKAELALNWVLKFLGDLPTIISNFFKGENKENPNAGPIGKAVMEFGSSIAKFITEDLPATVLNFIDNAIDAFGVIWDKLYKAIIGDTEKESKENQEKIAKATYPDAMVGHHTRKVESRWEIFVKKLGYTISHIWEQLPVWIANGIELAVKTIDEMIGNIGGWMKNMNLPEKVKKPAEQATENAVVAMTDSATSGEKKKEPALVEAINKIGERIKTLFVERIPGFISEAWTAISAMGSQIFEGFASIFDPNITPTTEVGQIINTFGTAVKNFIIEDIPKALQSAFDFISGLFGGKAQDSWKENLKKSNIGNLYGSVVQEIEGREREAKNKNNNNIFSFLEGIKEGFLNAFKQIGPTIIDGLATALDWLGSISGVITDLLTGDKKPSEVVEDTFGKQKPELLRALDHIGEAIKNFLLDTVPKFIGSAIGLLSKEAPEWFRKLFGAMQESAQDAEKDAAKDTKTSPEEAIDGVMSFLKGMLESLKVIFAGTGEYLEIIAIIVAMTMLLSKLSDLFTMADELEAGAKALKWTAITIAISAIAGIFAYITKIIDDSDPTKYTKFKEILGKLQEVLITVAAIMSLFTAVKIANAVKEIKTSDAGKVAKSMEDAGTFVDALMGGFEKFFAIVGVGGGIALAETAVGAGFDNMLDGVSEGFTKLAASMDNMMNILVPFIDDMVAVKDKLDTAIEVAGKIADLFGTMFNIFGELYQTATGNKVEGATYFEHYTALDSEGKTLTSGPWKPAISIEAFILALEQRLDAFNQLATFINRVVDSLSKFDNISDAETKMDEMSKILTGTKFQDFMKNLFNALQAAIEASDLAPGKTGRTNYIAMRESGVTAALEFLGSAFSVFSNGISGLNEQSVDALNKTLDVFVRIAQAFGDAKINEDVLENIILRNNNLAKIGREIRVFGTYVKSFYNDVITDIKGFDTDSATKRTQSVIDSVVKIAQGMAIAAGQLNYVMVDNKLRDFGSYLPGMGENIAGFIEAMTTQLVDYGVTQEKLDMAESATKALMNLTGILQMFPTNDPTARIRAMTQAFSDDTAVQDFTNSLANIVSVLYNALVGPDSKDTVVDIGKKFAEYIHEGVQFALDNDPNLKITLTPVLNTTTMAEQLKEFFGLDEKGNANMATLAASIRGANSQTDMDRVKATELNLKIDEVTKAITDLQNSQVSISDVTTAFAGMKIITDTGVLAGEMTDTIDSLIGQKIWLIQKGISLGPA